MSSRDKLIEELMRNQLGPMSGTRKLREQLIEQQEIVLRGVNKAALEAMAQAAAGVHRHMEDIYKNVGSAQITMLRDLVIPSISARIAEIASQALIPISQTYSSQVARIVAEAAQSFSASRVDITNLVASTLKGLDVARIHGDSINAAYAALLAENAKGFESLRESFAGILANALRQGFEHLDESDEQAFARLEELIDEKIATLPRNEVTAESLWKFLVTLFLSLTALGVSVYQLVDAKQTSQAQSKAQAEQQIKQDKIIAVLERIAINTGRLVPQQDNNIYYVVERKVDLKLKPNNCSHTIAIVFPNQKTRLVQMNHKWIYIEYFDYLEGIPKYGWANKKYLKRLDN